jgi:hypothetical protein
MRTKFNVEAISVVTLRYSLEKAAPIDVYAVPGVVPSQVGHAAFPLVIYTVFVILVTDLAVHVLPM